MSKVVMKVKSWCGKYIVCEIYEDELGRIDFGSYAFDIWLEEVKDEFCRKRCGKCIM